MWKDQTNSCFVTSFGCFVVTIFIVAKCYALQQEEEKRKRQSNTQGNKDDARHFSCKSRSNFCTLDPSKTTQNPYKIEI